MHGLMRESSRAAALYSTQYVIDNIDVIETLPTSATTVYGFIGGSIALPAIDARLAGNNANETLKTELLGLPVGAKLSDGVKTLTVTNANVNAIDLTGWNLAKLNVRVFDTSIDSFDVTVRSTTTESRYGSTVSTSKSLKVKLLEGTACANPVGVNPYVSYVNNTAVVTSGFANSNFSVSPLVATANSYNFGINTTQSIANTSAGMMDADMTMEAWLQGLDKTLSAALMREMMSAFGDGV